MKKTFLLSLSTLALGMLAHASTVNCFNSPTNVAGGNTGASPVTLVCQAIDAGVGFTIGNLQLQIAGDYSNGANSGNTVFETYSPLANFGNHNLTINGTFSSSSVSFDAGAPINPNPGYVTVETILVNAQTLAGFNITATSQVTLGSVSNSTVNAQLVYTAVSNAPEPATLGLMGTALAGLGLLSRRKK